MSISLHTAALHSKYDPWREAEKYLRHSAVPTDSETYILIEPGKGYLSHCLHNLNPAAKIIEVHCSNSIEPVEALKPLDSATWKPESEQSLSGFLSDQIDDIEIGSVSVIEWPPAERVFGSTYSGIKNGVRTFLQQRRATIHTTGKFGRLWLRNTIKRIAELPPLVQITSVHAPIVVAASGPSLNRALPILKSFRDRYFLMALPSSVTALRHARIVPDMIVHSDPGFYANYHLQEGTVPADASEAPIDAAPLYSSGHKRRVGRTALLSTATPIEDYFFRELDLQPVQIASHGTVAGLAFQFALQLSTAQNVEQATGGHPVIFTGLDFCFRDIIGHAIPHSFDPLLYSKTGRFQPLQQIYYTRSPRPQENEHLQSYALERYAGWFQQLTPAYQSQVFRLYPSEVPIPAFTDLDAEGFEQLLFSSQRVGSADIQSVNTRRIPTAVRYSALQRFSRTLRQEYEEFAKRAAAGSDNGAVEARSGNYILHTLRDFPLLMEFLQYTNYSLLFRVRRHEADCDELRDAFHTSMNEIDSILEAVLQL